MRATAIRVQSLSQPNADGFKVEDARWLAAARQNPQAFAPLYERYVERIYAYCARRTSDAEAEDLTSQIFAQALSGLQSFRGGSVAAWLFRIAHNAVGNHYRARRPYLSLDTHDFDLPDHNDEPLERAMSEEEHQRARALIDSLPHDSRDLLLLKLTGGLTSDEIGQVLGKTAGAVRVELHRIIERLRTQVRMEDAR